MSSINIISCRACLKSLGESFTSLDENIELLKLFEFCTGLSIFPQEKAGTVCNSCVSKIKSHAKFKRKCLDSNDIWKSLQTVKCNSKVEVHEVKTEEIEYTVFETDNDESCEVENDLLYETDKLANIKYECEVDVDHKSIKPKKDERYINIKKQIRKVKKHIKPKSEFKPKISIKKIGIDFCGLCSYSSERGKEYREHLSDHWSNKDLKCYICDFICQDSAELLTHRYVHRPNNGKVRIACHICEQKCASTLSLEFHYRAVHLARPGGFCTPCRKPFAVFSTWKKHSRLHNLDRFICDHCGKKFLYRNQIEAHLIDIGDTRNFICDACGKGFKRKYGLKTHMESVHSSEAIKCSHCDKVFKSQVTYRDHMKVVKAEKPHKCVHCGKTYHLESALRSHVFWHSGERPHACDVCGLKYKSKGQLKIHQRNHTGHMPFKCKECEKCFASSNSLKRHQSVHTGKRAHKCTLCERTFHWKKMLHEHLLGSHKDRSNVQTDSRGDEETLLKNEDP